MKTKKNYKPNETWLNRKYKNGEINTSLPFVSVNDPEFYADCENAVIIIEEIYNYWINEKSGKKMPLIGG